MTKKKGVNPLMVGLGVALGTAGAMFLSKKENRTKVKKAVKKIQADKGQSILNMVSDVMNNLNSLQEQPSLDGKKSGAKRKK